MKKDRSWRYDGGRTKELAIDITEHHHTTLVSPEMRHADQLETQRAEQEGMQLKQSRQRG